MFSGRCKGTWYASYGGRREINKYHVKLIMSDEYDVEAATPDQAEQIARDRFGCNYFIDEIEVKLEEIHEIK